MSGSELFQDGKSLVPMPTRDTARLVLLDEFDQVLLIRIENNDVEDPIKPLKKAFWVTPGGKIEPDESPEQAVRRELLEETGITEAEILGQVWYGEVDLLWKGEVTRLRERFFLTKVQKVVINVKGLSQEEKAVYRSHKWWKLEELFHSDDIFIPQHLPNLLEPLIRGDIPTSPITINLSTPETE